MRHCASALILMFALALSAGAEAQGAVASEATEAGGDPTLAAILPATPDGYEASVGPERRARVRASWPNRIAARIGGTYGRLDWAEDEFADRNDIVGVPGAVLRLGEMDVAGIEAGMEVAVFDHLRLGAGISFMTPVAGQAGGELRTNALGDGARVEDVHIVEWWGELGVAHRFGDLTLLATAHVGWLRTIVDLDSGCECPALVRSTRVTAGPHVGLRAHVFKALFVQAGARADALQWPDYVLDLSVGVGHRRH